jgi:hypothetical protein
MEVKMEEVERVMETSGSYSVASQTLEGELVTRPKGRPTKCTPEVVARAKAYAEDFKIDGNDDVIPSVEALALYLGVARQTVRKWADDPENEHFSTIVEDVLAKQSRMLINGALRGDLKEKTSSMLLSKHGYSEKQEVEHSASNGASGGFAISWGNNNAS